MKQAISNTLKNLGITPGLLGYQYLREAIEITMKDTNAVHHITKMIYPPLARIFKSSRTKVERDMRIAIERAWAHGTTEKQLAVFGDSIDAVRGRPTNSEFIATVADYLLLKQTNEEE